MLGLLSRAMYSPAYSISATIIAVLAGVLLAYSLQYAFSSEYYYKIPVSPPLTLGEARTSLLFARFADRLQAETGPGPGVWESRILYLGVFLGPGGSRLQPFIESSCDPPLDIVVNFSVVEIPGAAGGYSAFLVPDGSNSIGPAAVLPRDGVYVFALNATPATGDPVLGALCSFNATILATGPLKPPISMWGLLLACLVTVSPAAALLYYRGSLRGGGGVGWVMGSILSPMTAFLSSLLYVALVEPYSVKAAMERPRHYIEGDPVYWQLHVSNVIVPKMLEGLSPVLNVDFMIVWMLIVVSASVLSWAGLEARLEVFEELAVSSRARLALLRPAVVIGVSSLAPLAAFLSSLALSYPALYSAYVRQVALFALASLIILLLLAAFVYSMASLLVLALGRGVPVVMAMGIALVLLWAGRLPGFPSLQVIIDDMWRLYLSLLDSLPLFNVVGFTISVASYTLIPSPGSVIPAIALPALAPVLYTLYTIVYLRREVYA